MEMHTFQSYHTLRSVFARGEQHHTQDASGFVLRDNPVLARQEVARHTVECGSPPPRPRPIPVTRKRLPNCLGHSTCGWHWTQAQSQQRGCSPPEDVSEGVPEASWVPPTLCSAILSNEHLEGPAGCGESASECRRPPLLLLPRLKVQNRRGKRLR